LERGDWRVEIARSYRYSPILQSLNLLLLLRRDLHFDAELVRHRQRVGEIRRLDAEVAHLQARGATPVSVSPAQSGRHVEGGGLCDLTDRSGRRNSLKLTSSPSLYVDGDALDACRREGRQWIVVEARPVLANPLVAVVLIGGESVHPDGEGVLTQRGAQVVEVELSAAPRSPACCQPRPARPAGDAEFRQRAGEELLAPPDRRPWTLSRHDHKGALTGDRRAPSATGAASAAGASVGDGSDVAAVARRVAHCTLPAGSARSTASIILADSAKHCILLLFMLLCLLCLSASLRKSTLFRSASKTAAQ
jgi:hypothetical protein